MKIKKIVALILTCVLTISPLNSFAFAENETDLVAEVRQLKSQLNLSEADKKVLKSKIEDLVKKNKGLREKVENSNAKKNSIFRSIFKGIFNVIGVVIGKFVDLCFKLCVVIICMLFLWEMNHYNNMPFWKKWWFESKYTW